MYVHTINVNKLQAFLFNEYNYIDLHNISPYKIFSRTNNSVSKIITI